MSGSFYGYPGAVWTVTFGALSKLTAALATTSTPFNVLPLARAVMYTALNGIAAINAERIARTWSDAASSMQQLVVLPISVDAATTAFFNNRLAALTAASAALTSLVVQPTAVGIAATLNQGDAAIPDGGLLEFFRDFAYETPPAGLTAGALSTQATAIATSLQAIATQVSALQGDNQTYLYDYISRLASEASGFAELMVDFAPFSTLMSASFLWNQMVALPALLAHSDLLTGAPNSLAAQQDQLVRFLLLTAVVQLQKFILTAQRPVATQISTSQVMIGDSLMDIAARSLGNFERWTDVARFNKLQPPYIDKDKAPGIATWGSKVLLPPPGGVAPAGAAPNYLFNFLGIDVYLGPINGNTPKWTGDFQLVAGYDNYRWALGRRMQTALGKLIYHPDYGSRIPPEVGNIQTAAEAGYIAAFGRACLLSDPRTGAVLEATARLDDNFSIHFTGAVQPAGFGATPLSINEVINAAP